MLLGHRWLRRVLLQQPLTMQPKIKSRTTYTISESGHYRLNTPQHTGMPRRFASLKLSDYGLEVADFQFSRLYSFPFNCIRSVSIPTTMLGGSSEIILHLEVAQQWRILHLELPQEDASILLKNLTRLLPCQLIYHTGAASVGPIHARIAEQSLKGEWSLRDGIQVYLLPHLLVILQEDRVYGKLDLAQVQSVLAVDRLDKGTVSRGLDWLLNRPQSGIIRVQSQSEAVVFALPHYKDFAQEIALVSGCSLESLERDQKKQRL